MSCDVVYKDRNLPSSLKQDQLRTRFIAISPSFSNEEISSSINYFWEEITKNDPLERKERLYEIDTKTINTF